MPAIGQPVPPPPIPTGPIVDKDGRPTREWVSWYQQITKWAEAVTAVVTPL